MRAYLLLRAPNDVLLITATFQHAFNLQPEPGELAPLVPVLEKLMAAHEQAFIFGEQPLLRATYLPPRAPKKQDVPRKLPATLRVGSVCYGNLTQTGIEAEIERLERLSDHGRRVVLGYFSSALTCAKNAALAQQLKTGTNG